MKKAKNSHLYAESCFLKLTTMYLDHCFDSEIEIVAVDSHFMEKLIIGLPAEERVIFQQC